MKAARLRFSLATNLVRDILGGSIQSRRRELEVEREVDSRLSLSLMYYCRYARLTTTMGSGASKPEQEINSPADQTFFANRDSPVQVSLSHCGHSIRFVSLY